MYYLQKLQEELEPQEVAVKKINDLGEDLALQSKTNNAEHIKNQLDEINTCWITMFNQLSEIKRRQVLVCLALL